VGVEAVVLVQNTTENGYYASLKVGMGEVCSRTVLPKIRYNEYFERSCLQVLLFGDEDRRGNQHQPLDNTIAFKTWQFSFSMPLELCQVVAHQCM